MTTVDVATSWEQPVASVPMEVQTDDVFVYDVGQQTTDRREVATQTAQSAAARQAMGEDGKGDEPEELEGEGLEGMVGDRDDCGPEAFAAWVAPAGATASLEALTRRMLEALQGNVGSTALAQYRTDPESGTETAQQLHLLSWDPRKTFAVDLLPADGKLAATSVDWTATGRTVVAGYGQADVTGWCTTSGAVVLWNLFQRGFRAHEPSLVLDHSSAITCVKCHPQMPAVVAAGSFNGEVLLFDTSLEEPLVAASAIHQHYHCESISDLVWLPEAGGDGGYELCSLSKDGRVLFWTLRYGAGSALRGPIAGLRLSRRSSRRARRRLDDDDSKAGEGKDRDGTQGLQMPIGASCMSFSRGFYDLLVGSEGGAVQRLFTSEVRSLQRPRREDVEAAQGLVRHSPHRWARPVLEFLARMDPSYREELVRQVDKRLRQSAHANGGDDALPVVTLETVYSAQLDALRVHPAPKSFEFEPVAGLATAVEASASLRNLALVASSDGSLRLQSLLQARPLVDLNPNRGAVHAAAWSKVRPLVFAAGCDDGSCVLFDLGGLDNDGAEALVLEAPVGEGAEGGAGAAVSLAFNPKQRDFLGIAFKAGGVGIWQLPWRLSNRSEGEEERLKGIVSELGSIAEEQEIAGVLR